MVSVTVSSEVDLLGMIVVRGMRGVGGMCEMFMCLAREVYEVKGEWIRGLGLGFINPVVTGGVLDVCLYLDCGGVGAACGDWVRCLDHGLEWWGGFMSV